MRVLITGGYGFIGSHIAERFVKEGHDLSIIDDGPLELKEYVQGKHQFYQLKTDDEKCAAVFRNHNFDVVVFCTDANQSGTETAAAGNVQCNAAGLAHILMLAHQYQVKKMVYLSSAAVYGDSETLPSKENSVVQPCSLQGVHQAADEWYCHQWSKLYNLDTLVVRLSNVYGPRQGFTGNDSVISAFMRAMIAGRELTVFGDGMQTRDYVYIADVVEAVYRSATSQDVTGIINVATNTECSVQELVGILQTIGNVDRIQYEAMRPGDVKRSRLDCSKLVTELGWKPKYTLQEGLRATYHWYQNHVAKFSTVAEASAGKKLWRTFHPYLENGLLFVFMAFVNDKLTQGSWIELHLGMDYNYVYIAVMGLLYGKRQSLWATLLSSIIFISGALAHGADLVTIAYQMQYLLHLAVYLCIGVLTGYVADNMARITMEHEIELSNVKERYDFLQKMYVECSDIKDELFSQIVNYDDSVGKIYGVVRTLDSLSYEDIYTAAVHIVGKVMKHSAVDIYTFNKDGLYGRLKVRSGGGQCFLPNSLKISDHAYLGKMLKDHAVFVNKTLQQNCPSMAAPIFYHGDVIAMVQLYHVQFSKMTLYYANLLRIIVMMVSDALTKAYVYEQETQDKRYIAGTKIMVADDFNRLLTSIAERRKKFAIELALLRVAHQRTDYLHVHHALTGAIRTEDYVGLQADGYIYILLLNIADDMVPEAQRRIARHGIETLDVSGVLDVQ